MYIHSYWLWDISFDSWSLRCRGPNNCIMDLCRKSLDSEISYMYNVAEYLFQFSDPRLIVQDVVLFEVLG